MKKNSSQSGSTKEQLVIPGMEETLSSADSEDLRQWLKTVTFYETYGFNPPTRRG